MTHMVEYLYHVDKNDRVIGKTSINDVNKGVLLHRSVNIIVLNSKGEVFIHRRAKTKNLYPGYYCSQISGSVKYGETYKHAAIRELGEELGIKKPSIKFLFKEIIWERILHAFTAVYLITYDGKIKLQKEEIINGKFVSLKKLQAMTKKEKFVTFNFRFLNKYFKNNLNEKRAMIRF
jgi:isopentenyldiphosphate isomerase